MPLQQYSVSGTATVGWSGLGVRLGRLGLRVLAVVITRPSHWGQMIFLVPLGKDWRTLHWYLVNRPGFPGDSIGWEIMESWED